MPAAIPTVASIITTLTGLIVLAGWALGSTMVASLVGGWRVMVPSSAFSFVCVGLGLAIADARQAAGAVWVRLLALVSIVIPSLTLLEYALDVRWGVESWIGFSWDVISHDQYAGRMSAVTAACLLLLGAALAALTRTSQTATRVVRLGGGVVLTMSWIAVVAVSFEDARLADQPVFPGMAVLTIALFAVASVGVLACSTSVLARLRDVDADVVVPRWLVAGTFLVPLVLGRLRHALDNRLDAGLSVALVAVAFAATITLLVWSIAARMQIMRRQRSAVLAELETRVEERTMDLARANEQLRLREERLQEADRRKDEFLATLAHELRNPLAPVRTGFQVLKSPATSEAARTRVHQVIERQMEHLVRLIDDLLDVSRIAAGKLELRQDRMDLVDAVRHAIDATRDALDRAGHTLHTDLPSTPLLVIGDTTRLTQVVANLLQNACKYTPRGGQIAVSATTESTYATVRVRDNGIGIPSEFLPHIFEKFSQVASAINRSEGGLGLGLALVRGIVTRHGGTVAVHSDGAHGGSEFVIRIPLVTEARISPAATVSPQLPVVETCGTSRRVLVADDNVDNTDALAMLLRLRGHQVETALDGEAAFVTAERFRPDVALLDIGMPKMNGYELCRRIRQQTWGRGMRLIAQTGWGQLHDRRRSQEAGFDGHLVKPVDPATLDAIIQG